VSGANVVVRGPHHHTPRVDVEIMRYKDQYLFRNPVEVRRA